MYVCSQHTCNKLICLCAQSAATVCHANARFVICCFIVKIYATYVLHMSILGVGGGGVGGGTH